MLNVRIKKLNENAVIPTYSRHGDAGMDLTATSKWYDESGNVCYGTQLALEIPNGFVGLLFPRSSNTKKDLILGNSVGVIDSGYRGEVVFKFKELLPLERDVEFGAREYLVGDRIGQIVIMPIPKINLIECDDLGTSDRGTGAFGSTDPITAAIESNYSAE